jgi:pyridoxamine 5'-phosphate oxidase
MADHPDLPPWRSILAGVLHRNRSLPESRYLQLAMVNGRGRPTNRTVVFRGWLEPGSQLQFVTDGRSALREAAGTSKAAEISLNPWAEACWYFSKTREQFRIAGTLQLIDAENASYRSARQAAWEKMSAAGRAQFYWPLPGASRKDTEEYLPESTDPEPPAAFCLLLLNPVTVERLELRGNPQTRSRYSLLSDSARAGKSAEQNRLWSTEFINP